MQKRVDETLRTLMDLRDAFEEIHGDPSNFHSNISLKMIKVIRYWEDEYGTEVLKKAADRHRQKV